MQRIEHHRRERRVGERQWEIRGLVRVDVVVERARVTAQGGGAADIDVQVDEVRAVGNEIRPGQARRNAEDQQHRRQTVEARGC